MFGGGQSEPSKGKQSEQAAEEEDEEDEEGAEMMRVDSESGGMAEDQSAFGPLAALLVGFQAEEVEAFRSLLADMEADMVKIVPCSATQMGGTLQEALESEFPAYSQPPLGTRRTVFLSGMYGGEMVDVIAAYRESSLPATVWAAAVPNNYTRVVRELAEEVHADNAAMTRRAKEAQAQQEMQNQQP